jgi:Ca2+-binding RTX toxin-like protein/GH24 family phage-related lysozyme (muramidase)
MSMTYTALSGLLLDDNNFPGVIRNIEGYIAGIYDDGKHIATIGIGTNVQQVKAYLALTLKELGVFQAIAGETDAQRNARYDTIIQGFQSVIASHPLNRSPNQLPGTSTSEQALQIALNAELAIYVPGVEFKFLQESQAKNIVRQIALGFEIAPDTKPGDGASNGTYLKTAGIIEALDKRLGEPPYGVVVNHDTKEYQSLLSLQFNTKAGPTNLIGNNLRQALKDGDRAEAWYEIRYGSNGDKSTGIAKRRYYESELFGLYDTGSVSDAEAKSILQMYTRHRAEIATYEKKYGIWDEARGTQLDANGRTAMEAANQDYGLFGTALEIDTLYQALDAARTHIISAEVTSRGITRTIDGDVLVGQDADYITTKRTYYKNDILTGTDKNDLILGGEGNDRLEGGAGDDVLIGGAGVDVYVIQGHDIIIDEGQNYIVYNGEAIAGVFKNDGSGSTFTRDDGQPPLSFHSPGQIILSADDSITFQNQTSAADFADNDFGIHLIEENPPVPTLTLVGDHPAIDQDTGTSGIQAGYDHIHNLITDYHQVQARQDILYGSTENDLIQGLSGTDYLSGNGGTDILEGGTGNDALAGGLGDDTLKGGDGNDILLGDHVLATVDSYDYTKNASLIANITHTPDGQGVLVHSYQLSIGSQEATGAGGNDTIDGGLGDDIVFAGGGDDQVDGGDGTDVVFGDGGKDVILGGTGNDILVGDNYGAGVAYGDDYLSGGDGNDWLYGTGGNDYLEGGAGNDVLLGDGNGTADEGADVLVGGTGDDIEWRRAA